MIKEIINKINEYNRIIIHGHIRPDGDCYGSMLGLKSIIVNSYPNKEVYAIGERNEFLDFLGYMDKIEDSLYKESLVIVVDTATSDRVSDQRYKLGDCIIKIDHHIPIDNYGDINYVVTKSSCCEIISELFFSNQDILKVDDKGAKALYTGIVTDTGRFRFRGVNKDTLRIASYLLDYNVNVEEIDNNLGKTNFNMLKFKAYALNNIKTTPNGVIYTVFKEKDLIDYNISREEAAGMVGLLENVIDYPVWFILLEHNNELRLRIRSRGPRVDLLANKYNGGGHMLAAGASINSFDEFDLFLRDIDDLVKEYKNKGL